jgi:hypothetical protein
MVNRWSLQSSLTAFFFVAVLYFPSSVFCVSQDPQRLDLKKYEITTPPESEFDRPDFNIETYYQYGQIEEVVEYYRRQSVELDRRRASFWNRKFASVAEYKASVAANRREFIRLMGGLPLKRPLKVHKREVVKRTTQHTIERILLESRQNGLTVEGYLIVPVNKSHRRSAVVALHGQASNPMKVAGLAQEDYTRNFGLKLAERGHVVFAPYLISHGTVMDRLGGLASIFSDSLVKIHIAKIMSASIF